MSDDPRYAKPRRLDRRGFAQSTWRLVASLPYRIGLASICATVSLLLAARRQGCKSVVLAIAGAAVSNSVNTQHNSAVILRKNGQLPVIKQTLATYGKGPLNPLEYRVAWLQAIWI